MSWLVDTAPLDDADVDDQGFVARDLHPAAAPPPSWPARMGHRILRLLLRHLGTPG